MLSTNFNFKEICREIKLNATVYNCRKKFLKIFCLKKLNKQCIIAGKKLKRKKPYSGNDGKTTGKIVSY